MTLPESCDYRDLHADMSIPSVTEDDTRQYLAAFGKELTNTPKKLHTERFLRYIRVCSRDSVHFVKSMCRAEMKKHVAYEVDVKLDAHGVITECQCECAAGMGPEAHCKHVATVLLCLASFIKTGSLQVEESCTSKLQTFHKAKKHLGSPQKASALKLRSNSPSTNHFDPRPVQFKENPGYKAYFRAQCLNFRGAAKLPITHLFPPANVFAAAHDHNYLEKTWEDCFLQAVNVTAITEAEIQDLERKTRGQTANPEWFVERTKRIQSSNFGRICKGLADPDKFAESLTQSKSFHSPATDHGKKYENVAASAYEKEQGIITHKCGIFVHQDYPYLAASPDRIVDKTKLLEIKCPFTSRNKFISHVTVPYLEQYDGKLQLRRTHPYHYQIQGQLLCSERDVCDLFIYTFVDTQTIVVKRDQAFIDTMVTDLKLFFDKHFRQG